MSISTKSRKLNIALSIWFCIVFFVQAPLQNLLAFSSDEDTAITGASIVGTIEWSSLYAPKIIPDLNGDGYDDLILSEPGYERLYIYFGKSTGWQYNLDPETTADVILTGTQIISSAGDVNGDGYNDLLTCKGEKTWLIYGRKTGWPATSTAVTDFTSVVFTESRVDSGDYSGSVNEANFAGDVNADGYDDFVIGYPHFINWNNGRYSSSVFLVLGKAQQYSGSVDLYTQADASWHGDITRSVDDNDDYFGANLGWIGDVNADGYDDFAVSAYEDPAGGNDLGRTHIFYGKASGWARNQSKNTNNISFKGVVSNSRAGSTPASRGDINGDGYDDIIIGGYGDQTRISYGGAMYIFLGPSTRFGIDTLTTSADASYFGTVLEERIGKAVSFAGDVNGDGYNDISIGSGRGSFGSNRKGKVHLIYGKANGWTPGLNSSATDARWEGEVLGDEFVIINGTYGDLNGDGFDDVVGFARYNDQVINNGGKIYIIFSDASGTVDGTYKHFINSGSSKPVKFYESSVNIEFADVTSDSGYLSLTEHKNQDPPDFSGQTFGKYWTLIGTDLSNFSYNLQIKYNDAELNASGLNESKLGIYYKEESGKWTYANSTVDTTTNRIYTSSFIDHFSDWAIGEAPAPAPSITNENGTDYTVLSLQSDSDITTVADNEQEEGNDNQGNLPDTNDEPNESIKKTNGKLSTLLCCVFGVGFTAGIIIIFLIYKSRSKNHRKNYKHNKEDLNQ